MQVRSRLAVIVVLGCAAAAFLLRRSTPSIERESDLVGHLVASAERSTAGEQPVFLQALERQAISYGEMVDDDDLENFLIIDSERADTSSAWVVNTYDFTASFDIINVASQKKDVFFLVGTPTVLGQSEYIVERWKREYISSVTTRRKW